MTNNKEELNNLKIFGMLIVVAVASVLVITMVSSLNAFATILQDNADVDVEEAEEAGNATMAGSGMNQTSNGNMTGSNSTS